MKLRTLEVFVLAAILALPLFGQQAAPPVAPAHPAAGEKPKADAGELTELETKTLENLALRMQILTQEEASLPDRKRNIQMEYSTEVQNILASHPGFIWNPQAGRLMPAPKAPEKAREAKPDVKPAAPAAEVRK